MNLAVVLKIAAFKCRFGDDVFSPWWGQNACETTVKICECFITQLAVADARSKNEGGKA